jgi:hypothetical protein
MMRMRTIVAWGVLVLVLTGFSLAVAQEAPAEPTPVATGDQPADLEALAGEDLDVSSIEQILRGDQQVLEGEFFTYDPAGRRDPFRSLLEGFEELEGPAAAERPPGLAGMLVEEVVLQGIIQTPSGILAFVQGRDNLSYIIREGTQLYNGEVKMIELKRVVFRQQTNDPKQLKPYQDVVREIAE